MEAEEEVFEAKFFYLFASPCEQKNKINFDEKTDNDAEMEAFIYFFHEGVFLLVLISVTVFRILRHFKRENCLYVFLTF